MGKKKSRVFADAPRMRPTLYLRSDEIKIPKSVKGKIGKNVTLTVRAKVVSQRLNRDIGRKQTESYDLEISRIKSSGRRNGKGKRV